MVRLPILLSILAVTWGPTLSPPDPTKPANGEQLIQQMHDRYAGRWYRTLTFTQRTSFADGRVETWYESLELPGKLRIDIAPLDSMNTLLFRNDTLYQFSQGKLKEAKPLVHPLMVLGFDVYGAPVAETVRKLKNLKYDLSKIHERTWQGRPTYVVGAERGDTVSPQFWIDVERLYFVRSLEPSKKDSSVISDVRFEKYIPLGGGWVETEVLFLANGKQIVKEEYLEPRADVKFDTAIFKPDKWRAPGWVK